MYDYDKHISWYVYYTWILHENAHDKSMLTWTQKCLRYTEYFYGCIVLMQVLWLLSINERLVSLFCVCQYALYVRVTRDMLATEERNDMQVVHDEIWLLISWSGKWTNFWIYMNLYIIITLSLCFLTFFEISAMIFDLCAVTFLHRAYWIEAY